jgi:hypothetical protein
VHSPKYARLCGTITASVIAPVLLAGTEQKLAPAQSLSISAKEVGSTGSTSYNWTTSWGSYDKDFFTQQDVKIEAHNLSRLPAKIVVDFYFVGQPEHEAGPRKLFSNRTFTIEVSPGYLKRVSLRSDVLQSNEQRYVALGEQYNSGYHITGWFLKARVPGELRPFAYASSNPAWIERLGWVDPALAEFYREAPEANNEPGARSLSPPIAATVATQPAGKPISATPASYIRTIADVPLRLEYGEVVIRRGTRLRVVKRDATTVYVEFGSTVVPLSASVVQ